MLRVPTCSGGCRASPGPLWCFPPRTTVERQHARPASRARPRRRPASPRPTCLPSTATIASPPTGTLSPSTVTAWSAASRPAFAAGLPLTTRVDHRAVRGEALARRLATPGSIEASLDAEPGVLRRARSRSAACDDRAGGVARDREADADVRVHGAALDLRVDADDAAVAVEQRAARVAVVDRRVGLDRVRRW